MTDYARPLTILDAMIARELNIIATSTRYIGGQTGQDSSRPELIQQVTDYFSPGAEVSNHLKMEAITSAVVRLDILTKANDYLVKHRRFPANPLQDER